MVLMSRGYAPACSAVSRQPSDRIVLVGLYESDIGEISLITALDAEAANGYKMMISDPETRFGF